MRRIVFVLLAALVAGGVAFAAMDASAQQSAGAAEAQRADIAAFRTVFLAQDRAYSEAARAEAEARLAVLERQAGAVSPAYFELELSRIVALADNGHTALLPGSRAAHYNRVPLRLAYFPDGYYVVRAAPKHADLLGARLTSIDGHDLAALRVASRSLIGGAEGWRDRVAPYLFESPEQLHALELARRADWARYRFVLADGRSVTRVITAAPRRGAVVATIRGLFGEPYLMPAYEPEGMRTLLAAGAAPWSLQAPGETFRVRAAPEMNGHVVELRQTSNAANETIAAALERIEAQLREASPLNVVLEMRLNHGGDLNTARNFMRALPTIARGRIFVLTGPGTFSAAISSIGYLKQASPERVTIVGEPVGDRLRFFAEGGIEVLPNAGSYLLAATERHDYQTGCQGFADCHGSVVRHPIAVASLQPDIAAPWTIEAYSAGRDPAMEAVAAALR